MTRFGPTRSEWRLRLIISVFGLALVIGAYATNGVTGIASLEILIISVLFFGGSAIWSARALLRRGDNDDSDKKDGKTDAL